MINPLIYFRSNIKPFHDDEKLKFLVGALIDKLGIKTFYETGTFRGDTLQWVIDTFPDLIKVSVEKNVLYYLLTALRLHFDENTEYYRKDSVKMPVLHRIPVPALFWLDAHWGKVSPLTMELAKIRQWGEPCVIMIDDFQHPRRPLGFDEGVNLAKVEGSGLKFYVPAYDAPRGFAVAFQGLSSSSLPLEGILEPIEESVQVLSKPA